MNAYEIIKKYALDKKTWTHKAAHGVLHFFFPVGEEPLKPLLDYFGDSYNITVFSIHDDYGQWEWNDEDMHRLRDKFVKKVHDDPKWLDKFLADWENLLRKLDKSMQKIDSTELTVLSNEKLLALYYEWYKAYIDEYALAVGIQDAFSMHADKLLIPHLKNVISEDFETAYLALVTPVVESFITQEYRNRLGMVKEGDFEAHAKKYHWIHNNYAKDICLDSNFFKEQMKDIKDAEKELKDLDEDLVRLKKKKQELKIKYNFDQETMNLIKITEVFGYMQDERKKYVMLSTHYQNLFLKEFGKRLALSRKHMEYTVIHELKDLLESENIDTTVFDKRRKFVMSVQTLDGYELIEGETAKEIFERIFEKKEKSASEVKGSVASKGYAKGIVKIIRKTHDIANVVEGDILVASMTRPDMVMAMKKAAAIVTDEGGITSHAAVVSRELGIPCIIGTRVATKVLKDGDLVEVNADNGVVRKL